MRGSMWSVVLAAFGAGALLAGVPSGMVQPEESQPEEAGEPSIEELLRAGEPGPEHELLGRIVGEWDLEMAFEGEEPISGSATNAWGLGGRFLETEFRLPQYFGRPFRGRGISGFDRVRGVYVNVWMNSFSTQLTMRTGVADGDQIAFEGTSYREDGEHPSRVVLRVEGADRYTETVYDLGADGVWAQRGRVTFTRRGG
ncbi:MAG: DUF1579 family protein [Phycisphaerales bacterium JB040]